MYCKNCGTKNQDDVFYCSNCGAKLTPVDSVRQEPRVSGRLSDTKRQAGTRRRKTGRKRPVVFLASCAGIGIAVGVLMVLFVHFRGGLGGETGTDFMTVKAAQDAGAEQEETRKTVEYPEGSVILSDTTSANGSDEVLEKSTYVYNEYGYLQQLVKYKKDENGEYVVDSYCNYYYYPEDSDKICYEFEYILNPDGSSKKNTVTGCSRDEKGNLISKNVSVSLPGESVKSDYYTYTWDETGSFLQREVNQNEYENVTDYIYSSDSGSPVLIRTDYTPGSFIGTPKQTRYDYDDKGNCIAETTLVYHDSLGWTASDRIEFEYDDRGNVTARRVYDTETGSYDKIEDAEWILDEAYTWEYDSLGHKIYASSKTDNRNTYDTTYVYGNPEESRTLIMQYEELMETNG